MGRRKAYFTIEQAARKVRKVTRDEKRVKRTAKGPTIGQKLAAKMHAKKK